jgi:Transcription factor WhiB
MTNDWLDRAACRNRTDGVNIDTFFPERGGDFSAPKAICATCPVTAECMEWGLREKYGVFGGTSERQRRKIRHDRGMKPLPPHGTSGRYELELQDGLGTCAECRAANNHRNRRHRGVA